MHRSQLETKYLKTKTQTNLKLYKKHLSYIKERRKYYESSDMKNVLRQKKIGKQWDPFLSDKNTVFSQISIEINNQIISDDFVFPEEFIRSFINLEPDEYYLSKWHGKLKQPSVEIVIRKFENHPSVQAIKQNISVNRNFYFSS